MACNLFFLCDFIRHDSFCLWHHNKKFRWKQSNLRSSLKVENLQSIFNMHFSITMAVIVFSSIFYNSCSTLENESCSERYFSGQPMDSTAFTFSNSLWSHLNRFDCSLKKMISTTAALQQLKLWLKFTLYVGNSSICQM